MSKPLIRTIILISLGLAVAGCTPSDGDPSGTPSSSPAVPVAPGLSLSAPPTIDAGDPLTVVINSSGYEGEQAQLYAFFSEYDTPADCADTSVTPTQVTLKSGPQPVTVSTTGKWGEVSWMLTGPGVTSECGTVKTRILANAHVSWSGFSTGHITFPSGSGDSQVNLQSSDVGTYHVIAGFPETVASVGAVTVTWVGPFTTAPEANRTPCPTEPVAATTTFTMKLSAEGNDLADPVPVPVSTPGIYRLMVSAPATEYTMAQVPVCEDATLVVIV